jgi:transporter family protein
MAVNAACGNQTNLSEVTNMWIVYALLAALFAGATSILAKIGISNVNSNLAVAIRTVVVLIMAWGIVFITGKHNELSGIGQKSWLFLVLSGCATGLSWLFFYKALQIGDASRVIPIDKLSVVIAMVLAFVVLGETVNIKTVIGGLLIAAGTLVIAVK